MLLGKYGRRLDICPGRETTLSGGNRMIKGGFAWLRRIGRNSRRKSESLAIQPCSLFLSANVPTNQPTTHTLRSPLVILRELSSKPAAPSKPSNSRVPLGKHPAPPRNPPPRIPKSSGVTELYPGMVATSIPTSRNRREKRLRRATEVSSTSFWRPNEVVGFGLRGNNQGSWVSRGFQATFSLENERSRDRILEI